MLEVSLPEGIIKLYKLTCRRLIYHFSPSTNVYSVSEDGVQTFNQGGTYLSGTQEYVRGVKNGLYISFRPDGHVDKIILFKNGYGVEKFCLFKKATHVLGDRFKLLMPILLKKHMLNKENNKNEKEKDL